MYNYSVIVCGCTQNSSTYIYNNLLKLYNMNAIFTKFKFVVYENDSTDNTVSILEEFKLSNPNFDYISEKNIQQHIPIQWCPRVRSIFIAYCRNKLINYVLSNYMDYDYMIMVDLDNVIDKFNVNQMQYVFNTNMQWDALFANCLGKYYDIWALRINNSLWNPNIHGKLWNHPIDYDCWERAIGEHNAKKYVYDHQICIPVKTPLIPVSSAFGGFGVYKISKIINCTYSGIQNNRIVCEHVSFHEQMIAKNDAKLYICPALLMNAQPNHTS